MKVSFTLSSLLNNKKHNTSITTKTTSNENECINPTESCAICHKKFIPLNFYTNSKTTGAFASTCLNCTNTCGQCGDDIGFAKLNVISNEICSYCDHVCCKSCGINIECKKCGDVICSGCVDEGKGCRNCKQIMESLRKQYIDIN